MLYVYHGTDIDRRRQAITAIKKQLRKKRPAAEIFEIDHDEFSPAQLTELVGSRGLFEDKYIVLLYQLVTTGVGAEAVSEHAPRMAESDHVFVIVEDELPNQHESTLAEYAQKVQKLDKERDDEEAKPWPLADAYGNRDTHTAWLELQKALKSSNNTPESIQGLLWWQTKMIWLAKTTDSAEEAGQKSYPYKKAKKFAQNFTVDALKNRTKRLLTIYHEAHQGEYELNRALEQFILEI